MTTIAPGAADLEKLPDLNTSLSRVREPGPALEAPGPSMLRLVRMELRKSVDTRSGMWVLLAIVGLAVAALGYRLLKADQAEVAFTGYLENVMIGVMLLLPVIGVMAMTSEWSQRTALSTFTLVPRRGRVLAAKILAAVLLGVAAAAVVTALTALGLLAGSAITGETASWSGSVDAVTGLAIMTVLNLMMAVGVGALAGNTAVALVAYFVLPTGWSVAGTAVLGTKAEWLDVWSAMDQVATQDIYTSVPKIAVALTVWVVVPLVVGVVLSMRREAK